MFNEQIWGKTFGNLAFSKLQRYDLRKLKPEIDALGQRLWDGDWSVVSELAEKHMLICATIAAHVATKYRQDVDEMIGYAFLGIVDACTKILRHEAILTNVTGYIITRSKSFCMNHCEDLDTGMTRNEMNTFKVNEHGVPSRHDVTEIDIGQPSEREVQHEFIDSFLPKLTDIELEVFTLYLQFYADEDIRDELKIGKTKMSEIKARIEWKLNEECGDGKIEIFWGVNCEDGNE